MMVLLLKIWTRLKPCLNWKETKEKLIKTSFQNYFDEKSDVE
jgi:hypothetical protein